MSKRQQVVLWFQSTFNCFLDLFISQLHEVVFLAIRNFRFLRISMGQNKQNKMFGNIYIYIYNIYIYIIIYIYIFTFIFLHNVLRCISIYTLPYPLEVICSVYVVPSSKVALTINTAY